MIIDFKYHIASLVAVFLALGIGILIGSTLLGNSTIIDYQKQVTDRLENQLQTLREENKIMEAKANTLEIDQNTNKQFEEHVMPLLVSERISGKKFALIDLNSVGFPPELTEVIHDAGGEITSVTSVNTFYNNAADFLDLKQQLGWQDRKDEELLKQLGAEIATCVITGEQQNMVDVLTEADFCKKSGQYGVAIDGILLVGGSYQEQKRSVMLDLALIDYFKEINLNVVGLEETDVLHSSMKEYQRKHISTIDNIDTAPGRLATVLTLAGQSGHYGIKSTAQKLLPDLDTGGQ